MVRITRKVVREGFSICSAHEQLIIKTINNNLYNATYSKTFKVEQHTLERWKNGEKRMFEKLFVGPQKII